MELVILGIALVIGTKRKCIGPAQQRIVDQQPTAAVNSVNRSEMLAKKFGNLTSTIVKVSDKTGLYPTYSALRP